MKKHCIPFIFVLLAFLVSSCLTTEYKEYRFTFNPDGSGSGYIKYVNIVSQEDEDEDVSFSDFGEIIDNYLNGTSFENDHPNFVVTKKDIYEENGVLCGTVEFTFNSFSMAGFYTFAGCDCAPLLYYLSSFSETYVESNGNHIGQEENIDFPLIAWNNGVKEVYFKTSVQSDLSDCVSLLPLYKTWKETQ